MMNASQKAAIRRQSLAEASARQQEHQRRVAHQRATFFFVPPGPEKTTLRLAMLERAWWLLDAGETEAADALLEFVPDHDADTLLFQFFETTNQFNPALYPELRNR